MTQKEIAIIQRALGVIEGATLAADDKIAGVVGDQIAVIEDALDRMLERGGR